MLWPVYATTIKLDKWLVQFDRDLAGSPVASLSVDTKAVSIVLVSQSLVLSLWQLTMCRFCSFQT